MKHVRQKNLAPGELGRTVMTIGNFDGVHRGHQQVLRRLRMAADKAQLPAGAITFEPHPVQLLAPEKGMKMIFPFSTREQLLAKNGVDILITAEFTVELSQTPSEKWAVEVLVELLQVQTLIIGYDFSFGRGDDGDARLLVQLGRKYGFTVEQVPALVIDGRPISSSRIRRLVEAGELSIANSLLGRPFHLTGEVVHGDGRGHSIGFPTANLKTEAQLLPHVGVYGAATEVDGKLYQTALSIGRNPTFDLRELRVEAFLLDYEGDLYGKTIEVHVLQRLRDEIKYSDASHLTEAIHKDVRKVRQLFAGRAPEEWLS